MCLYGGYERKAIASYFIAYGYCALRPLPHFDDNLCEAIIINALIKIKTEKDGTPNKRPTEEGKNSYTQERERKTKNLSN